MKPEGHPLKFCSRAKEIDKIYYFERLNQQECVVCFFVSQEFKGYVFKIMGGCDKQGFPMKKGVLTSGRVRLLLHRGTPCFRGYGRRNGECRRKSVCGCIVSQDLSVINLVIVKKGENDLPGLTDTEKPRMRGPKRASNIIKLFNLNKNDDVRKYVNTYHMTFTTKNDLTLVGFDSLSPKCLHALSWLFTLLLGTLLVMCWMGFLTMSHRKQARPLPQ
ncbi:hypothetical protein ACJX0J_042504, partial [Zea mays]